MFKRLLISLGLLAVGTAAIASSFEGVATYKLLGKDAKKGPREMEFSIKGDKFRTDLKQEGHAGAMIMNNKSKEMITLMPDQQKYMVMKLDGKGAKGAKGKTPKFTKTGKTETIAGYKAEEWVLEGAEHKTSLWGTKELGAWAFSGDPKGPNGGIDIPTEFKDGFFLLRVVGEKGSGMEATKVEKKPVPASLFEIPAGYEKMEMGGMMGGPAGAGSKGHGMSDAQKKEMFEAMKDMSPEQRKTMEKVFKGK